VERRSEESDEVKAGRDIVIDLRVQKERAEDIKHVRICRGQQIHVKIKVALNRDVWIRENHKIYPNKACSD